MSLLTTINWLTDLLLKSETTKTTMTWIAEPESWQWGEVIYNQIVTWTAFVILVMFILICGSNFLAVSLIMIFLMTIFEILVHIGLMAFLWRCNFFIGGEGQEDLWMLTQERKTFFSPFLLDPFYRRGWVYKRKFCVPVCLSVCP